MIENVTQSEFVDRFIKIDRENNFTYWGRVALYEYLVDYEESCETQIEFDPIALCCEFTEYKNLEEFNLDYDTPYTMEQIRDNTQVIEITALKNMEYVSAGFIVGAF